MYEWPWHTQEAGLGAHPPQVIWHDNGLAITVRVHGQRDELVQQDVLFVVFGQPPAARQRRHKHRKQEHILGQRQQSDM
jgi:hypothetical protein